MASWLWLVAGGLVIAAVAVALIARRRRTGPPAAAAAPAVPPVVALVQIGAAALAVVALVDTIVRVAVMLSAPEVTTRLPFAEFWPQTLPTVQIGQGPTATVVSGSIAEGTAVISGLSLPTRALLAGELIMRGAVATVIPIAFFVLCRHLRYGSPFASAVSRWGRISAVAIAVGGLGQQILGGIGGYRAAEESLRVTGWSVRDPFAIDDLGGLHGTGLPMPSFSLEVEFAPIGLALAVWVITELVAIGARMQAENTRLRQDTEGLV